MIQFPAEYITDSAPKRDEALQLSNLLIDSLFKPFPKVDFAWPNNGLNAYYFDFVASHGQNWSPGFIDQDGEFYG